MQISPLEQAKENSLAGGRRLHYFVSPNVFFDFFFFTAFQQKVLPGKTHSLEFPVLHLYLA